MNTTIRLMALALITLLGLAGVIRLSLDDVEQRVDLHAVLEIWSDVIRDVEQVPLTITRMSGAEEMVLGDKLHKSLGFRIRDDAAEVRYLSEIGQRLAGHAQRDGIHYRFHVIEDWRVNAYALPGGHVYFTRGMLNFVEVEAELASIVGHEISHIDLRHCVQQFQYQRWAARAVGEDLAVLARIARTLFMLGFSEQQEIEADARGMVMAAAAGYDPAAAIEVERKLIARRPEDKRVRPPTVTGEVADAVAEALGEYFDTHPSGARRVDALRAVYRRNAPAWRGSRFYVGRTNFLDSVSLEAEARDDEWVAFRELDSLGSPPTPPAKRVAVPEADAPPAATPESHHLIYEWNVTARAVAVLKEPRHGAPVLSHFERHDDVFVTVRVGLTSWVQVRIQHAGRPQTGFLLEQDLLHPVGIPAPAESKNLMMEKSDRDICVGMRYGHLDYVDEANRRGLTLETCQQSGN